MLAIRHARPSSQSIARVHPLCTLSLLPTEPRKDATGLPAGRSARLCAVEQANSGSAHLNTEAGLELVDASYSRAFFELFQPEPCR